MAFTDQANVQRQAPVRPAAPLPNAADHLQWRTQFFRAKGWTSKTEDQKVLKAAIQPMVDKTLQGLIGTPGSAGPLTKDAKWLDPGKEFKTYM